MNLICDLCGIKILDKSVLEVFERIDVYGNQEVHAILHRECSNKVAKVIRGYLIDYKEGKVSRVMIAARDIMSSLAAFNYLDDLIIKVINDAIKPEGLDAFEICKTYGITYRILRLKDDKNISDRD